MMTRPLVLPLALSALLVACSGDLDAGTNQASTAGTAGAAGTAAHAGSAGHAGSEQAGTHAGTSTAGTSTTAAGTNSAGGASGAGAGPDAWVPAGAGGTSPLGYASKDEFAASLEQVVCGAIGACCSASAMYLSTSKCAEKLPKSDGSYDPTAGKACLDKMTAQVASADFCTNYYAGWDEALSFCSSVLSAATQKLGEHCDYNTLRCQPSEDGPVECLGTPMDGDGLSCVLHLAGKLGDGPCLFTMIDYAGQRYSGGGSVNHTPSTTLFFCNYNDGLWCPPDGNSCTALKSQGETCTVFEASGNPCSDGLHCVDGSCQPQIPDGQDCPHSDSTITQDSPFDCLTGTLCLSTTYTCSPPLPEGSYCEVDQDCQSVFCHHHTCVPGNVWHPSCSE